MHVDTFNFVPEIVEQCKCYFSFPWSLDITERDTESETPKRDRGGEQWLNPHLHCESQKKRSMTEVENRDSHWVICQGNKILLKEPYCKSPLP